MYIVPNSTINLLTGIPLDNSYAHTLYFSTDTAQETYFSGKLKRKLVDYSYVRKENKLNVNIDADKILDCNYLMFQNTSYGNKWFYCFITNIEYIGNECSEITFELDVMQTWFFDYELLPSFIEREHSTTDNIGDNLVDENLEIGEYMYSDLGLTSLFSLYQIVVVASFDKLLQDAVGGMYGGVYSGLCYNVFSSYTECNSFLQLVTDGNKSDGIVSIYMLPLAFCSDYQETVPQAFEIERDKYLNNIGGYIPQNKKLLTYPYNLMYVTNNEGVSGNFRYEFFNSDKCGFKLSGAMCTTPEIMLVPKNYKGVDLNYNEKMVIGNFPQCAYTIDSFRAYIAQNSTRIATDIGMGIIRTGVGAIAMGASGGLLGASEVVGGISSITNSLASISDKSTMPPQAKGNASSMVNMANGIKGFQFYHVQITFDFARIIDDFFSVYGYATKRVKVPNRNSRPQWNYVKTINCNLKGSVPTNDIVKIKRIHDNGVTYWKNGANLGNYTLNNRPS